MFIVNRSKHNPILVPNRDHYWEAFATFNMSVVKKGKMLYGLYRAISAPDKLRTPERVSIIGIGKSKDGVHFEDRIPFITPEEKWEKYGCEDPRVTYFEGQYYIFYTALSNYPFNAEGIKVAVAVSKDLKKVTERHLVTPFNAKAMSLFPKRVNGKITVIVAVNTDMPPVKLAIAQFDNIEDLWNADFWNAWYQDIDRYVIDLKRSPYDHVEVGAAPIETPFGYLLTYSHIQNYFASPQNLDKVFGIETILLDKKDPFRILGRTRGPVLVPTEPYELFGYVGNVIFPSGSFLNKETLSIYYGAADTTTCLATVNINDLISTMSRDTFAEYSLQRFPGNPILLPIKSNTWESKAVFNPAALRIKDTIHILYRALSEDMLNQKTESISLNV